MAPARDLMREPQTLKRLGVALVPGTALMLGFLWRSSASPYGGRRFALFDDATISLTYARTFAETGQLVWYDGADRVQGITNPLWAMYMAGLHLIGLSGSSASLVVSLTGVALILASAALAHAIVTRAVPDPHTARACGLAAAAVVPLLYPLVFWSLRGMEVGLLAMLLLAMLWGLGGDTSRRGRLIVYAAAALGVATRLDFAVIAVAVLLWRMAIPADSGSRSASRHRVAAWGMVTVVGTAGAVLAVQRWYYGGWLPNTYHLKVDGYSKPEVIVRGVVSLAKVLPVVAAVTLAALAVRRDGNQQARDAVGAGASAVVAAALYSVWVGGDAWEDFLLFSRYTTVTLPAAVAVVAIGVGVVSSRSVHVPLGRLRWLAIVPVTSIAAGLVSNPYRFHVRYAALMLVVTSAFAVAAYLLLRPEAAPHRGRPAAVAAVCCGLVLAAAGTYPFASWARNGGLHVADDQRKVAQGVALGELTDPAAVIATSWAGAPGYYADRPMIDLLGKSDRVIATVPPRGDLYPGHNKFDYDYSIGGLRPDVVFQEWTADDQRTAQLATWGYERWCFALPNGELTPSYFRTDSVLVDRSALTACP